MTEDHARPRGQSRWPLAFAVCFLALLGTGIYVFNVVRGIPGSAIDKGREVLKDVERIAQAFRTGTVTTSFISYATEVSGSNFLQFASLKQVEVFERRDGSTVFWGAVELPEVVVEARAPVEYTYFLDLDKPWELRLEERLIRVLAPPIEFNTPAVDPSALRFEVRERSVFRNEDLALEKLRAGLTEAARQRARENVPLVREVGRRKTAEFVEKWLAKSYSDAADYRVEVVFVDEIPRRPETPPR